MCVFFLFFLFCFVLVFLRGFTFYFLVHGTGAYCDYEGKRITAVQNVPICQRTYCCVDLLFFFLFLSCCCCYFFEAFLPRAADSRAAARLGLPDGDLVAPTLSAL